MVGKRRRCGRPRGVMTFCLTRGFVEQIGGTFRAPFCRQWGNTQRPGKRAIRARWHRHCRATFRALGFLPSGVIRHVKPETAYRASESDHFSAPPFRARGQPDQADGIVPNGDRTSQSGLPHQWCPPLHAGDIPPRLLSGWRRSMRANSW